MEINKKDNKIFELERANDYKVKEINKSVENFVRDSRKVSERADLLGKQYCDVEKKYGRLVERIFFVDEKIDEKDRRIEELVRKLDFSLGENFEAGD